MPWRPGESSSAVNHLRSRAENHPLPSLPAGKPDASPESILPAPFPTAMEASAGQPSNMLLMSVTREVSKPETSREASEVQS